VCAVYVSLEPNGLMHRAIWKGWHGAWGHTPCTQSYPFWVRVPIYCDRSFAI